MIPDFRKKYNDFFTEEKYQKFLQDCNAEAGYHIDFRIAETPIFIPDALKKKILAAAEEIYSVVTSPEYIKKSEDAIPSNLKVPGEPSHPSTLALDFAVCKNEAGELTPQLIELQAFPSLFGYQHWLAGMFRKYFEIPASVTHLFRGMDHDSYIATLRKWIVGNHDPKNVVLLEIEPEKQKTRVDFELTKKFLGIEYVCISKVILEGKKLFYEKNGERIPIHRIYNRIIFDEFAKRTDLNCQFHLTEEVDAEWVSHPNWFFRISKFSLPFLNSIYVPQSYFLKDLKELPEDLENYVLKPLFSFAGAGVLFDVKKEDIERIEDRSNYLLMKKVNYEPVIEAPDGGVKTEIRVLFLWLNEFSKPEPMITVVRLSRGKMIGVDFNKNKTWVGGSVGFFQS